MDRPAERFCGNCGWRDKALGACRFKPVVQIVESHSGRGNFIEDWPFTHDDAWCNQWRPASVAKES